MVRAIVEYSPFAKAMADHYRENTKDTMRVDSSDEGESGDYQERLFNLLSPKEFLRRYIEDVIEICEELMIHDDFYVNDMLHYKDPQVRFLALALQDFYDDNPSIMDITLIIPIDLNGNIVFISGAE